MSNRPRTSRTVQEGPTLPAPRGPLSTAVLHRLRHPGVPHPAPDTATADPYGEDLQLALYTCYELHYRGFEGVDAGLEWDPALLGLRAALEERFLTALRADTPAHKTLSDALEDLLVEPVDTPGAPTATGVSHFLRDEGAPEHLREYAAHRSLYHLKEADPHAWVLPRLWGRAKAAMAAVEFDEYGGGRPERVHARLFADLMTDLDLDTGYGHYLDATCAEMLANVNLMSLFGLHRGLRGALVGHFATVEITSSPAPAAWRRRCGARVPGRPPGSSTTSTSRRTPCTSRSSAGTSSAACWSRNRSWRRTSPSASTRRSTWRAASVSASWRPGGPAVPPCAPLSHRPPRPSSGPRGQVKIFEEIAGTRHP